MKAIIEYSRITHSYFIQMPEDTITGDSSGQLYRRKDVATKAAKILGATEIIYKVRNTAKDLRDLGFSRDKAKFLAKEYYG
jgi:hypothetical protein